MPVTLYSNPLPATVLDVPWGLTRDLSLSIEYFLRTKAYERNDVASSVFDHFRDDQRKNTDISFERGYPDDLTKLKLPALALEIPDMDAPIETMAAGGQYIQEPRHYTLYGFAGGENDTSIYKNNGAQMVALRDDLYYLLNGDHGDGAMIDLYHFSDDGSIDTDYSSTGVVLSDVAVSSPGVIGVTPAERYRFVIEFTVTALTSRR